MTWHRMFLEALQAYYAPAVGLVIFGVMLAVDQLLGKREKKLFLLELFIIAAMILSTWADRCVSIVTHGETFWRIRSVTSFIQFGFSAFSPLILVLIYRKEQSGRAGLLFFAPAAVSLAFSAASFFTGWVFRVGPGNVYQRGPLFALPFAASAVYILIMIRLAAKQDKPSKRAETVFICGVAIALAGACMLEIVFVIRYMIWSTTMVCAALYFLLLSIQKVLYDALTGAYSRVACVKRMEALGPREELTLAMIDLNGLKAINDRYGHAEGDQAIVQVARAVLGVHMRGAKLYRYGGDEFILIVRGRVKNRLESELERVGTGCGRIEKSELSFAFGIVERPNGGGMQETLDEMDRLMYEKKRSMKRLGA